MRREYEEPRPRHVRATAWCFDWWNESIQKNHWPGHKSQRAVKYLKVPWQQHLQIHRKLNKTRLASILNARQNCTGNHCCGWRDLPFPIPIVFTSFSINCQCGMLWYGSWLFRFLDVFFFSSLQTPLTALVLFYIVANAFVHGGMSHWGPMKGRDCVSIISRHCGAEPPWRIGSNPLI